MRLAKGKPNPLNFFNCRTFEYPAKHLYYIDIERSNFNLESAIKTWIDQNLAGRFYVSRVQNFNNSSNTRSLIRIGFENPSEASYFQLACPLLKY